MTTKQLIEENVLINNAPANLFRGMESVGGKLTITNKRLIFSSHALNIQAGTTEIFISDIESVTKRNTLLLVPNGMLVKMKNGVEHKFVVMKRDKLIKTIIGCM